MDRLKNVLYFLRNFPAWIPLLGVFIFLIMLYYKTNDAAYKEIAGLAFVAFSTALGIQRSLPAQQDTNPQQNLNVDTLNAQTVSASSIPLDEIQPEEIKFDNIEQNK